MPLTPLSYYVYQKRLNVLKAPMFVVGPQEKRDARVFDPQIELTARCPFGHTIDRGLHSAMIGEKDTPEIMINKIYFFISFFFFYL